MNRVKEQRMVLSWRYVPPLLKLQGSLDSIDNSSQVYFELDVNASQSDAVSFQ